MKPAPQGLPDWLVYFAFMVLVGVMFWCLALLREADPSPLLRAIFILDMAALVALPYVPRERKGSR